MAKVSIVAVLACFALLLVAQSAIATEVNVIDFPKNVVPGETAQVKINWADVPTDKDYVIRVQLEDWDAKPQICSFIDLPLTSSSGETTAALPIAKNSGSSTSAKFVVAALSKSKAWDDCVASNGTEKVVTVTNGLAFEIADSPKTVSKGSTVQVKLSWKGIKSGNGYKLIVQLENWDMKPGFAYVTTADDFKADEERTFTIKIPADAPAATGGRFVAAFISKTSEWKDVYAISQTSKDVEIK